MPILGVDLGGTKLALGIFSEAGDLLHRDGAVLGERGGERVGELIVEHISRMLEVTARGGDPARAIGVAIPGIYDADRGRVWAPNISGWEDYPLLEQLRAAVGPDIQVAIESDRACHVLGDAWRGAARGCRNVVFIIVGTGIGAGVLVEGRVLRGHRDIAGAIGWLGLDRPYRPDYQSWGCFEHHASGPGLVRVTRELLLSRADYAGPLRELERGSITPADVFAAADAGDPIALEVIDNAVQLWGMATANLVSVLDPEIVVFGGGVFGPAGRLLDRIRVEALRWAQPISMPQVVLAVTPLGADAGLFGAGHLALRALSSHA